MIGFPKTPGPRHPLLRDALLWAIPAILLGAGLRWLLLAYQPYAYWGSDSDSYFDLADRLLNRGRFHMEEKRRYLYPLLMVPVALLPGSALKWLAWLQHGFGLLTLVPLAYVVRKSFVCWRVIALLATLLYAALPMVLWYEHELLGENLFFAAMIWAMAGWAAWTSQAESARARRLWWWFFAAFAVLLLTKPSGRFVVPGVVLGLVAVRAWRTLGWKEVLPIPAVIAFSLTMGTDKQSSWLLYSSSFPLTRLETPLHAAYKAEIRDLVTEAHAHLGSYFLMDEGPKAFLKYPEKHPERPLWAALGKDDELRPKIYRDLALEGVRARPDLFLFISAQKILQSSRFDKFRMERFDSDYFSRRFEQFHDELVAEKPAVFRELFGIPQAEPLPTYAAMAPRLGRPGTNSERWLKAFLNPLPKVFGLVDERPEGFQKGWAVGAFRIAPCGWLFLAGALLSLLRPYRGNVALWLLIAVGYLFGVFLIGSANPRFFGAAWPAIVLATLVPVDLLLRAVSGRLRTPAPAAAAVPPRDALAAEKP